MDLDSAAQPLPVSFDPSLQLGLPLIDREHATPAGLLAPVPRCCPTCLETQQGLGELIVVPLQWSLGPVTRCIRHGAPLQSICPACGAKQQFISDAVPRGRCSSCGGRLGYREGLWLNGAASARELFMAEAVNEMLTLGHEAEALASLDVFTSQINAVSVFKCGRGIRHLEREIGFRKHSTSLTAVGRSTARQQRSEKTPYLKGGVASCSLSRASRR